MTPPQPRPPPRRSALGKPSRPAPAGHRAAPFRTPVGGRESGRGLASPCAWPQGPRRRPRRGCPAGRARGGCPLWPPAGSARRPGSRRPGKRPKLRPLGVRRWKPQPRPPHRPPQRLALRPMPRSRSQQLSRSPRRSARRPARRPARRRLLRLQATEASAGETLGPQARKGWPATHPLAHFLSFFSGVLSPLRRRRRPRYRRSRTRRRGLSWCVGSPRFSGSLQGGRPPARFLARIIRRIRRGTAGGAPARSQRHASHPRCGRWRPRARARGSGDRPRARSRRGTSKAPTRRPLAPESSNGRPLHRTRRGPRR
mmetsp:Transcript_16645/g.38518  ORF Transcript_16645/g.38518 Transcript_16645/m.38518 type:complete len:313 (+) Transcript_16645:249-1187(+)